MVWRRQIKSSYGRVILNAWILWFKIPFNKQISQFSQGHSFHTEKRNISFSVIIRKSKWNQFYSYRITSLIEIALSLLLVTLSKIWISHWETRSIILHQCFPAHGHLNNFLGVVANCCFHCTVSPWIPKLLSLVMSWMKLSVTKTLCKSPNRSEVIFSHLSPLNCTTVTLIL